MQSVELSELAAAVLGVAMILIPIVNRSLDRFLPSRQTQALQLLADSSAKHTELLAELVRVSREVAVQRARDEELHKTHFAVTEDGIRESRGMLLQIMQSQRTSS